MISKGQVRDEKISHGIITLTFQQAPIGTLLFLERYSSRFTPNLLRFHPNYPHILTTCIINKN